MESRKIAGFFGKQKKEAGQDKEDSDSKDPGISSDMLDESHEDAADRERNKAIHLHNQAEL